MTRHIADDRRRDFQQPNTAAHSAGNIAVVESKPRDMDSWRRTQRQALPAVRQG